MNKLMRGQRTLLTLLQAVMFYAVVLPQSKQRAYLCLEKSLELEVTAK